MPSLSSSFDDYNRVEELGHTVIKGRHFVAPFLLPWFEEGLSKGVFSLANLLLYTLIPILCLKVYE